MISEQELAEIEKRANQMTPWGIVAAAKDVHILTAEIRRLQKFKDECQANKSIWIEREEYDKMRAALQFYADEKNHIFDIDYVYSSLDASEVMKDAGARAREVLG